MTENERKARLERRLAAYAVAAGSAIAASAGSAQGGGTAVNEIPVDCRKVNIQVDLVNGTIRVNGQIQAGPPQQDEVVSVDIDVNDDGIDDFRLNVRAGDPLNQPPYGFEADIYGFYKSGFGDFNRVVSIDAGAGSSRPKLSAFERGEILQLNSVRRAGAKVDTDDKDGVISDADLRPADRFIGFRFADADDLPRLGFARVQLDPGSGLVRIFEFGVSQEAADSSSFIVIDCDFAGNLTISGGGCAVEGQRDPFELAPLGVLALGAAGLALARRRRLRAS